MLDTVGWSERAADIRQGLPGVVTWHLDLQVQAAGDVGFWPDLITTLKTE